MKKIHCGVPMSKVGDSYEQFAYKCESCSRVFVQRKAHHQRRVVLEAIPVQRPSLRERLSAMLSSIFNKRDDESLSQIADALRG